MSFDAAMFSGGGLKIVGGGAYVQKRSLTNEFAIEPLANGGVSIDGTRYLSGATVLFNGCCFTSSVEPVGRVRVITTKGDRYLLPEAGKFTLLVSGDLRDNQTNTVLRDQNVVANEQTAARASVFDAITGKDVQAEAAEWADGRDIDSELACTICMVRPRGRALLLPCKHAQFCCACALTAKTTGACPTCRQPIEQAVKIFS
jgi:hypothetical protein